MTRGSICFLCSLIIACSALASRAEDDKKTRLEADQVQVLQSEISDSAHFKNYVEGSRQLPEGSANPPPTQVLSAPSSQAAPSKPQLSPALSGLRQEHEAFPPAPIGASRPAEPTNEGWPELPVEGLIVAASLAVGWLARRGMRESELPPAPACGPLPVDLVVEARSVDAPTLSSLPDAPVVITPPAPTNMALPVTAQETFIDIRMPVSTWRAISWREQRLIDIWDASPEKALGQASFEEWLDAQGNVEGVDLAMLNTKLSRDV